MPPDWYLSVWITDLVGRNSVVDEVMGIVASNYFAPRLAIMVVLLVWFGTRDAIQRLYSQKAIISIAIGVAIAFTVAESLCLIQDRLGDLWTRPYDTHPEAQAAMDQLYHKLPDSSFPSNAMCGIAPIAAGLWYANRRASIAVWALVFLWGLGRIYVGIHYPSDIAGGILIGVFSLLIAQKLVWAFDKEITSLVGGARKLYLA